MSNPISPSVVMAEAERVMQRPFVWGACDCCSAACDVFATLWGFDPMAPVRGYGSVRDVARLMRRHSGLMALAETLADRAGLVEGHAPGGLACDGRSLLICIQPGLWAGKSKHGLAILRKVEKGWHIA